MDGQRFDTLTRAIAAATSRRSIVKAMLGSAGGALLSGLGLDRLIAAQEACRGSGRLCGDHDQCCSGRCDPATERCACEDGERYCDGECVAVEANLEHCGECGNACADGEECCSGECRPSCPLGRQYDPETCRCVCATGLTTCGNACCERDQTCTDRRCCTDAGGTCSATKRCCDGLACCDGRCVDTANDPNHCGGCGDACEVDPYLCQAPTCTDGVCGTTEQPNGAECVAGDDTYACCDNVCADLYEEPHCGACNVSCGPDETCCRGEGCYDLTSSTDHCGGCYHACDPDETCYGGICCPELGSDCTDDEECCPGHGCCGGQCVDITSDVGHCGGCDQSCEGGEPCNGGVCGGQPIEPVDGGAGEGGPGEGGPGEGGPEGGGEVGSACGQGAPCGQGYACCRGTCADFRSDPANCGGCDRPCREGQSCLDGVCVGAQLAIVGCGGGPACDDGQRCCGGSCLEVESDPVNCGGCGAACGSGEVCCRGACYAPCGEGTTWDESACSCRCEDGRPRCGEGPSASCCAAEERCDGGVCGPRGDAGDPCQTSDDCGEGVACCDGQCVATAINRDHCGGCGYACPSGQECCDGSCTSLLTTLDCGACGNVCPSGALCRDGECRCTHGTSLCDGACRDYQTDRDHCGGCGSSCPEGESCSGGYCESDQVPCDCAEGQVCCGNTCVDTQTNPSYCGDCETNCPGDVATCRVGSCEVGSCGTQPAPDGAECVEGDPYYACCDGYCADLRTSGEHCGACGEECAYGYSCCGGSCYNTQTDPRHCGDCETACDEGQICDGGYCTEEPCREDGDCEADEVCCDGDCAVLSSDPGHCGDCGASCPSGQVCAEGRCCSPAGVACGESYRCCQGTVCDPQVETCVIASCETDGDCPSGTRCDQGSCFETCVPPRSCQVSEDCGATDYWFCARYGESGICYARCESDDACCEGDVCRDPSPVPDAGFRYCLTSCRSDEACQEDWTCYVPPSAQDGICGLACEYGGACAEDGRVCCPYETCCDGTCYDPRSDAANCGGCGRSCAPGEICYEGDCRAITGATGDPCGDTGECGSDLACCGGVCTDTISDAGHCGACDAPCDEGWICCEGVCYDPLTDLDRCGGCEISCPRSTDPGLCQRRTCVEGVCGYEPAPEGVSCNLTDPAYLCCGEAPSGSCVDTGASNAHCGACGAPCPTGTRCEDGTCGTCERGLTCGDDDDCCVGEYCDGGTCRFVQLAPEVCDEEPQVCQTPEDCVPPGPWFCAITGGQGVCVIVCTPDSPCCPDDTCYPRFEGDEIGFCFTPCEIDEDCREGWSCYDAQLGGQPRVCLPTCTPRSTCEDDVECCPEQGCCDGACIDLWSDPANCGQCEQACQTGEICERGQCLPVDGQTGETCGDTTCPEGWGCCDDQCYDLGQSSEHCGGCGNRCTGPELCIEGRCCVIDGGSCTTSGECCEGLGCDPASGVCVNRADLVCADDGGCPSGYVCGTKPGGERACCVEAGQTCHEACRPGEPCEYCCSDYCGGDTTCGDCAPGGSCDEANPCCGGLSCCDGTCVDTANDPDHCSQCGFACPETNEGDLCRRRSCAVGVCGYVNVPNDSPCRPNDPTAYCCDGACTDTANDSAHCGACGVVCGGDQVCIEGSCCTIDNGACSSSDECCEGLVCDAGSGVCVNAADAPCGDDNPCPSGSLCCGERCVDPATDPYHCGDCGVSCPYGEHCDGGCVTCTPGQSCAAEDEGTTGSCCAREYCTNGQCQPVSLREGDSCESDRDCVAGLLCCDGSCTDTWTRGDQCGACGQACPSGYPCCNGVCVDPAICPVGYQELAFSLPEGCRCSGPDGFCGLEGLYGCEVGGDRACCEGFECRDNVCVPANGADGCGQPPTSCTYHGDCPEGYDCAGGSCRYRCGRSGDCCEGEVCVNVPAAQTAYCLPDCDANGGCVGDAYRCCEASCYDESGSELGFCTYCADIGNLPFACGSCGQTCDQYYCAAGVCACTPDGASCATSDVCCSGYCDGEGRCGPNPTGCVPGGPCTTVDDCCEGERCYQTANGGFCSFADPGCGFGGDPCSIDGDCCDDFYCAEGGTCQLINGVDGTPPANGAAIETCENDGGCESGYTCCYGRCTRTSEDPWNCGACGYRCPSDDCREAICADGVCGYENRPNATPCTAGGCVENGACQNGVCQGQLVADGSPCDDRNACTLNGVCGNGVCTSVTVPDGTPCRSGNECLTRTACSGGVCRGEYAPYGRECEAGGCLEEPGFCDWGRCVGQPRADGTTCDDGERCTENDICVAGICRGEKTRCEDYNPACADPFCDYDFGCGYAPKPDGIGCGENGETCCGGTCCPVENLCQNELCIEAQVETCGGGPACDPAVATCLADRCCPHEGVCNGACCDYGNEQGLYSHFCHAGGCCRVHLICGGECCGGGADTTLDNDLICTCGTCRPTRQPCVDGACQSCPEDGEWGEVCVTGEDGSGICCPAYRACGSVCCGPEQHCENGACADGWPRRFRIA